VESREREIDILFYDVSSLQELAEFNGKKISFGNLYDLYVKRKKHLSPKLILGREEFCAMSFHPYGNDQNGWKSWEKYFSTATQLLSDHSPSKQETKVIREYVRRLPGEFKKSYVDKRFILSFVSYLFIAFKGKVFDSFNSEFNYIEDLVSFTLALHSPGKKTFSSFLCAHREPKVNEEINLLQSFIPRDKVRRALSLLFGMLSNIPGKEKRRIILLQQKPTYFATSSIFPEVTVDYFSKANICEMMNVINYQYQLIEDVVQELSGEKVKGKLVNLDNLTVRIERFLQDRFGKEWRHKDFTLDEYYSDPIVEIAVNMTLPGVKRMMPFFSNDFQKKFLLQKNEILQKNKEKALSVGGKDYAVLIEGVTEWFMLQHSMNITAKAVYETTFYYLWGKYCGTFKNLFAIGLDREHNRFQHFSWKLGYRDGQGKSNSFKLAPLYVRRNPSSKNNGNLADLSFRQFWRCDRC
jgi:hypothetical protein